MSEYAVLKALAAEPMTTRQLQMRLSASLAKPMTEAIVLRLQAQGKVAAIKGGRWQPTAYGLSSLPQPMVKREWGKYVPPRVVRRAGSERASKLPSMFAGERIFPWERT